jgi:hypothetical protein
MIEYGAFGGLRIGRGNRSTRRKPVPVPLYILLLPILLLIPLPPIMNSGSPGRYSNKEPSQKASNPENIPRVIRAKKVKR